MATDAPFQLRKRKWEEPFLCDEEKQKQKKLNPKFSINLLFTLCFVLGLGYYKVAQLEYQLLPSSYHTDETNSGRFIADNAYNHVQNLTKLGPRPVGSFENEVMAVNLLSRELNLIANKAAKIHRVNIEFQKASGSFSLDFLDGMTSVYRNVQNVILKIGPHSDSHYSILLNCHFDTVTDSPGGSDNSAGCAVMLEILRVIAVTPIVLKHNIIFLFNGAEENILQGSHGFITQHKWAKGIRAFINLEACGTGGRELLFQVGPENPWLMEVYSTSVKYPLASSIAQEVFQSGLIPADTDYRIFRDFGNIPGFDFAWAINGYVYHTKHDNAENVPIASLQRTGDNLLPLTVNLANMDYPYETPKFGNLVFFDVLGIIMFRIAESTSKLLALFLITYSCYVIKENAKIVKEECLNRKSSYYIELIITAIVTVISWIATVIFVSFLSQIVIILDRCMSWYARPLWAFFLYGVPAIWVPAKINDFLKERQFKKLMSSWLIFSLHVDALQLILISTVLLLTFFNIRSTVFLTLYLLFLTVTNHCVQKIRSTDDSGEGKKSIIVYVLMMLLPYLQVSYIVNGTLLVIIPIMGRAGSGHNIEGLIAILSSIMFLFMFSYLIPLFSLMDQFKKAVRTFYVMTIAALFILLFTPWGFPYSSDKTSLAPQRFMLLHTEQVFHEFDGSIVRNQGGYWIIDLDVNSPRSVKRIVPQITKALKIDSCDTNLYCGLPYLIPVLSIIRESHWLPAPKPLIAIPMDLMLIDIKMRDDNIRRYYFSAKGPDHMTIILSPVIDAELISWSFLNEPPLSGPTWNGRKTYFVYYSCASDPMPLNFTIDLKVKPVNSSVLDIAITGHFLHGAHQRSIKLKKLLSQFPPWTTTSGWIASYKSYKF